MKLRKLILLAVAPMMCFAVHAQEVCPKKGDLTVAATVSYNSYTSMKALAGNQSSYSLSAASTNWNDKQLMVGIEGGWFFKDLWKASLGGGMNITKKPGCTGIPGTGNSVGDLPTYTAVADESLIQFSLTAGVDRYIKTKVNGLMPYGGVRLGYSYGRNEAFWDEADYMGKSVGESLNVCGALAVGVDYFLNDAIFVGAQIYPFAYTYNRTLIKPQEGLENLSANSHNFGFLAAPTLKFGFKF